MFCKVCKVSLCHLRNFYLIIILFGSERRGCWRHWNPDKNTSTKLVPAKSVDLTLVPFTFLWKDWLVCMRELPRLRWLNWELASYADVLTVFQPEVGARGSLLSSLPGWCNWIDLLRQINSRPFISHWNKWIIFSIVLTDIRVWCSVQLELTKSTSCASVLPSHLCLGETGCNDKIKMVTPGWR